jgi:hypothetical protein
VYTYKYAPCTGARNIVISTKTRLSVGLPGSIVSIPGRDKESALGLTHPPIPLVLVSLSVREKWPVCADDHKPASGAEVKGEGWKLKLHLNLSN